LFLLSETMFPLILASEDRVHALRAPELQGILDAVLFEPGKYLELGLEGRAPVHVPATRDADRALLASAHGHLLNELHRAPRAACDAVLSLLRRVDLSLGSNQTEEEFHFHSN